MPFNLDYVRASRLQPKLHSSECSEINCNHSNCKTVKTTHRTMVKLGNETIRGGSFTKMAQARLSMPTRESKMAGTTVSQALVKKMMKANEAEVELAKMAKERSKNQQVQKLADSIILDHQAANQELEKFSMKQTTSVNNTGQTDSQPSQSSSPIVPQQLCKITEQSCANTLEMTKEMLTSHESQEFDMAFLGQQCMAHTMMIAELKAIQSQGPQDLRPLTETAIAKAESHLKQAKKLAKQIKTQAKKSPRVDS